MYNSLDWTPEECGRYNTNYGSDNMMQSSRYCYGNKYFNDGDVVNDAHDTDYDDYDDK